MDFNKACKILELKTSTFSHTELKKSYYRLALQHHPDKQLINNGCVDKFREVQQSYNFLCEYLNANDLYNVSDAYNVSDTYNVSGAYNVSDAYNLDFSFNSLLNKFINLTTGINFDISTLKTSINTSYKTISLKAFEGLDKDTALKVFEYIEQYSTVLGIDNEIIASMKTMLREKLRNDVIIILNPTIDNLINEEIYKLNYNESDYFIPLWHDEITYDVSGHSIIVKCIPDLPQHISIDENNNICVNINLSISSLLERKNIELIIGSKPHYIPVYELKIMKLQTYILTCCGIPKIDSSNLFNNKQKSDIHINITLN